MTVSVVIPYMEIDQGKRQVLESTVKSFKGYDELIVISNWQKGYAKPINHGLKLSTGDFIVVMNDDLEWDGGSLKRLCVDGVVTSPKVNGQSQPFWGCAFCLPRTVYEKVGGLWEGYRVSYFDDDDYRQTLEKNGVPMQCVEGVDIKTQGGRTLEQFPDRDEFFEENKKIYQSRWG